MKEEYWQDLDQFLEQLKRKTTDVNIVTEREKERERERENTTEIMNYLLEKLMTVTFMPPPSYIYIHIYIK